MTELEKTNASLSFLNRQDELDREWEERLLLQEVRLERVQRRVGDRGIDGDGDGDRDGGRGRGRGGRVEVEAIANPLFCPELVGMGS